MNNKLNKLIDEYLYDSNKINTDLNDEEYKYYLKKLNDLENNEPSKLFIKSHKKWEKEKEILLKNIELSHNKLLGNYKDIEKQILN